MPINAYSMQDNDPRTRAAVLRMAVRDIEALEAEHPEASDENRAACRAWLTGLPVMLLDGYPAGWASVVFNLAVNIARNRFLDRRPLVKRRPFTCEDIAGWGVEAAAGLLLEALRVLEAAGVLFPVDTPGRSASWSLPDSLIFERERMTPEQAYALDALAAPEALAELEARADALEASA